MDEINLKTLDMEEPIWNLTYFSSSFGPPSCTLPFFTSSAVSSPLYPFTWSQTLAFEMGLFPQFSVLQSQKLPNVRLWLAFFRNQFIFVCSTRAQFQSVCVLKHLKTSACISARHKVCSTGVKMGVCPLYPPCWELVISFQTQMILPALSTEHCNASPIRQLFSSAQNLRILYDNHVHRNEETQSMKHDFNMRLYCVRGSWS